MKILLDFDDLYSEYPYDCLNSIDYLVKEIPNIKILLFTIPNLNNKKITNKNNFIERVKNHIKAGNIKIGVHGNTHEVLEFKELDYNVAYNKIQESHNIFNDLEIPFVKVFKGPYWGINKNTIEALKDLGYKDIFNHEDYSFLENIKDINFIYYNWNLKDDLDLSKINSDFIIAHGHTHNVCDNGIFEVKEKIVYFIKKHNLEPSYDILHHTNI